jgi:predicted ABC-type transport system involved in lysophospholipase L1 biosynthesis ATPase subunit
MAGSAEPVLEMHGVTKTYNALRPLRIASLAISAGERVSLGGIDAGVGELLVNLITGASLPDAGEIRVFGRLTSEIPDGDAWLESLERFGIVSPRGVLLEGSTVLQNLAMPFTLEIDPVREDTAAQVRQLAERCGIDAGRWLGVMAGEVPGDVRVRIHLARSLALRPQFLLIEHPTADVNAADRRQLAADVLAACSDTGVTILVLTNDETFARAVAPRNVRLDGATGLLKPISKGWLPW